ncbi:thermonuclease family protein [Candidatus Saccharibacteria bacterium]|nr:thermonuclease family protein [Candidatus Saccharibacteria bacterium]
MKLGKRQRRKLFKIGFALVLSGLIWYMNRQVGPPPQVIGTQSPGYYKVTSFEDGDTITVDMNGKQERIRMIGVDTPETQDPRKPVQCFGKAASQFTRSLIGSQNVRLEADELSDNRDRYNRLLRYVYLPDSRLVQAEIIKQGYGFAYTSFPFTKSAEFKTYEQHARENNQGLWNACEPTTNQFGGHTSNPE